MICPSAIFFPIMLNFKYKCILCLFYVKRFKKYEWTFIFSSLLCDKKIIIFMFLLVSCFVFNKTFDHFLRHTKHTLIMFIHHGHPLFNIHCLAYLLPKFMFPFKIDINKSSIPFKAPHMSKGLWPFLGRRRTY